MGPNHHNDSMSEQGAIHTVEVTGNGANLNIPNGVTNVELIASGSSTYTVTKLGTPKRPGRKVIIHVRDGQTFTARITETTDEISTAGSFRDLAAGDTIILQCRRQASASAELVWTEIGFTNLT